MAGPSRIARRELAGEDLSAWPLSAWLVGDGLALASRRHSTRLLPEEDRARAGKHGPWRTTLEPLGYRAQRWETAKREAPKGCPIQGQRRRRQRADPPPALGLGVARAHEHHPGLTHVISHLKAAPA